MMALPVVARRSRSCLPSRPDELRDEGVGLVEVQRERPGLEAFVDLDVNRSRSRRDGEDLGVGHRSQSFSQAGSRARAGAREIGLADASVKMWVLF